MSISACPRCAAQVSIPAGVSNTAKVRCPHCRETFALADALAGLPPMLEVVDELDDLSSDWQPPTATDTIAAQTAEEAAHLEAEGAPAEAALTDSTLDFGTADVEETLEFNEAPVEELPAVTADTDDAMFMSEKDTEIEETGFAPSDPLVREPAPEIEPIEAASIDEQTMFEFERRQADADKLPPTPGDEEPLDLYFDEQEPAGEPVAADATIEFTPTPSDAPAEEEIELNFDEFTPAEEADASEAATMEFSAMPAAHLSGEGEEEIDFGQPDANAETIETSALGFVRDPGEPPAEGDEIALDFGEPVAVDAEQAAADEASEDNGKKKAKKAKKEKKAKVVDESGEEVPRRRSLVGTLVSLSVSALFALALSLYGIMWLGPDYDFFKFGKTLAAWKVPLPSAYSKPKMVATIAPPVSTQPDPSAPTPTESAPPAGAPAPNAAAAEPGAAPVEPAPAAADATPPTTPPGQEAPAAEPGEQPTPPPTEPPAAASAAEQPLPEPTKEMPAPPVPATAAAEPLKQEPDKAASAPAAEPAAPEEEKTPPVDATADAKPAIPPPADDLPAEAPAEEMPEPAALKTVEPRVAAKPTEEDLPLPDLDETPKQPSAAPSADDRPALGDEPAAPADIDLIGPADAPEFTLADLGKAMQTAGAAEAKLMAAQTAKDEAAIKTARSQFYLNFFRMAEVLTFARDADAARLEANRASIEKIVSQFASDKKRLDALKFNSARWLAFAKRTTPGIALAGTVIGAERAGKLHELRVNVGLAGTDASAVVVSRDNPQLNPGDQVFVLGSIVERPGERLIGFDGDEPAAVWSGMIVKLPAEK